LRKSFLPLLLLRVRSLGTSHSSTACSCPWARSAPAAQHLHTPPAPTARTLAPPARRRPCSAPAPLANRSSARSPRAATSARPHH
jgi:hypothetical protein